MKTLARKIAEVTAAVKHPPQTGHNKFHNYRYSTRDDIFGVIRGELASRGVAIMPSVMTVERSPTGRKSKSGAEIICFVVRVAIGLVDSETGEECEQVWEGESHTEDDKGVPQAVTQALRFWATNTFMLLDGSDEQMYGQPGTQTPPAQNVHRETAPAASAEDAIKEAKSLMAARLKGLGFGIEDVKGLFAYIALENEAPSIDDVHPGKVKLWADRMTSAPDDKVKSKIKTVLASSDQEAA